MEVIERENILVSNKRHKDILKKAYITLDRIKELSDDTSSIDLMATDVKSAINYLGEIVGEVFTDDILDKIFSQFCIGK